MSRTDAHVPVWVRVNRRDLPAEPWHASRHDSCDLPPEPIAGPESPDSRCHWQFWGDPEHRVCSCEMCYGSTYRRLDVRRDRRRARQQLDAGRRRSGTGLDEMGGPRRCRDRWT